MPISVEQSDVYKKSVERGEGVIERCRSLKWGQFCQCISMYTLAELDRKLFLFIAKHLLTLFFSFP
jgi:hypothetical protein